jgi:C_GCAxxG_C_C family probable redox protein
MTDPAQTANNLHERGFNCSQAIFTTFAPQYGLSDEMALKLASPFGGGFARQGEVCGALVGALMVLGLQYGNLTPEGKDDTYHTAQSFIDQFRKSHGAIRCSELIGYDLSTPEGLKAAREHNVFASICPNLIMATAKALTKFSEEPTDK